MVTKKPPSEKAIEKAVCDHAKAKGVVVKKMQTGLGGTAGWPDRMFIHNGNVYFIEFKRSGGKLSPLQEAMISLLQYHKIHTYVVDNIQYGKEVVDGEMHREWV